MKKIFFLFPLLVMLVLGSWSSLAQADSDLPAVDPAFSSSNSSSSQDQSLNDSRQAQKAAAHHLYLPSRTPLPVENYRWPSRRVTIYLATQDSQLRLAFRQAVQAWNRTGAVRISWVADRDRADIIANDGSLTTNGTVPGAVTSQLGTTRTSYNPDTHALIRATSTLDGTRLATGSSAQRRRVAEHELGHALGLAHAPENAHSVMVPQNVQTEITSKDRQTIRCLYDAGK